MGDKHVMKRGSVCDFSEVRLEHGRPEPLSFSTGAGELWIIEVPRSVDRPDVAGAAVGLVEPGGGSVRVFSRDWGALVLEEEERVRQRTGRVFDGRHGASWLQNLDIEENVLLPHTVAGSEPVKETGARMLRLGA